MVPTLALRAALLACLVIAPLGEARAQDDVERGRTLVTKLCGECHAVGRTGASPNGRAPTFRSLDDHTDLDQFMDRLRQGQQSTHPDRPAFRFSRDDAQAAVAYLRSVQGP
jgi:mono/diheme cytochrome c family protein